jgi:hypothetical protein
LSGSLVVLVSQSLPSLATHSASGSEHFEVPHVELEQAGVPTLEVQTLPQPPQLLTLTVVSVSQPSSRPLAQSACPGLQVMPQVPLAGSRQLALPPLSEQRLSQLPQVSGAPRSASQPFQGSPSQSAKPALHATVQVPPVHLPLPFAGMHTLPQPPQLRPSASVGVSQPFDGSPSQSVKPWAQRGTHSPSLHSVVP